MAWECIAFRIQYNVSQTNLFKTEAFGSGFYLGKKNEKRKEKKKRKAMLLPNRQAHHFFELRTKNAVNRTNYRKNNYVIVPGVRWVHARRHRKPCSAVQGKCLSKKHPCKSSLRENCLCSDFKVGKVQLENELLWTNSAPMELRIYYILQYWCIW